jgi:hypothetical protein
MGYSRLPLQLARYRKKAARQSSSRHQQPKGLCKKEAHTHRLLGAAGWCRIEWPSWKKKKKKKWLRDFSEYKCAIHFLCSCHCKEDPLNAAFHSDDSFAFRRWWPNGEIKNEKNKKRQPSIIITDSRTAKQSRGSSWICVCVCVCAGAAIGADPQRRQGGRVNGDED